MQCTSTAIHAIVCTVRSTILGDAIIHLGWGNTCQVSCRKYNVGLTVEYRQTQRVAENMYVSPFATATVNAPVYVMTVQHSTVYGETGGYQSNRQ